MAFGQVSGPPASARQLDTLARLLEEADFGTFREARHRLGLTQRQANGRFTVDEATALIDQLSAPAAPAAPNAPAGAVTTAAERRLAREQAELLAAVSDESIADELARRGWLCMPPTD